MNEKAAMRPELAVGEALRAIAHDILANARAAITDQAQAKAVHDFRRDMKRWRALLRLIEPYVGEDVADQDARARDLARELGAARDPQSALDALDDLARHNLPVSSRSLKLLRKRIEGLRAAGETTALSADKRARIAAALADADAAVDRWPLHIMTFADVSKALAGGYRAARRALPDDWQAASPETLHEFRKLVVAHRYQMQIVEPLWPRFARMWIAEAQRLRERLGKHQDLDVLDRLTGPGQPLAAWRERLAPALAARKSRHVAAAKRLATRLFVEKPGAFRRRLDVMWETGR